MAQLDTRIPLAVQPPDLIGSYERGLSIRDVMDKRQMAEEERQAQRTLADLYRGNVGADGQVNRTGLVQGLASAGQGARIPGVQKQFADMDKAALDVKNTQSQISERELGAARKRLEATGAGLHSLLSNPNATPDDALGVLQGLVNGGVMTPEEGAKAWREVPTGSPQQFRSYLMQKGLQIADASKRLEMMAPKVDIRDTGGGIQQFSTNQLTGQTTAGPQLAAKTPTPDALITDERQRSEGAANRGVTMRGQNFTNDRARDANNIASAGNVIKSETDLRKEFADLPEVKRYKAALPAFNAVQAASQRATPQSDINLVYGVAKLYDPDSVVREGEYATIANSQAIPEWIKGAAQRVAGGGRLTAETKRQIMVEARGRIDSYEAEHQGAKATYENITKRRGGDPSNVFTPTGVSRAAAPDGLPVPVKSDADYNRLPAGTKFVTPDGRTGTKR